MNLFLICFTSGAAFLLGFLLFFHPLQQNVKANRWLGFFAFIIGAAFMGTYISQTETGIAGSLLLKGINGLQFLLAPSLFFSTLYFVKPGKTFSKTDWLHFLPFAIYTGAAFLLAPGIKDLATAPLFEINRNSSFLVRDLLPFLTLFYLVRSCLAIRKHKTNIKRVVSSIRHINLDWLLQFMFILALTIIFWINDALFGLPWLTGAMPYVYAGSVFFLAWFSIKQKTIFVFREKDIKEISGILETDDYLTEIKQDTGTALPRPETAGSPGTTEPSPENQKHQRLNPDQVARLSAQLKNLMEKEKLFLDNDLNLPTVAQKLGISLHETSYLINTTTGGNFYTLINTCRVEEAKKLLRSAKADELNMLGIAFASGFNSKTTFNTTFRKMAGISPSQYGKEYKKLP